MKKIVIFSICFLMMWIQNVSAQSSGSRYDYLKHRLQVINGKLRGATGARRKSLERQKFLVRARLARLASEVCNERSGYSPIKGSKSCRKKKTTKRHSRQLPKIEVVCPQDRKFGSQYDRNNNVLTIYLCNGLDGKDGQHARIKQVLVRRTKRGEKPRAEYKDSKLILYLPRARRGRRGRPGRPGDRIKSVEVIYLTHGEKPRAKYHDSKLTFYLPKAKDGRDGKPGERGRKSERMLPDWLKIYAGGFYLLNHGLRHNLGGMVGMGFVLVPKRLDLLIEGGLGYEAHFRMLSGYVKGGLGINFHPMVGMNISAFGNWNLNYRNLAEFEALGGTLGVDVLIAKHFRISADLFLGQLRWPDENRVHKTFGVSVIFTIGYQF